MSALNIISLHTRWGFQSMFISVKELTIYTFCSPSEEYFNLKFKIQSQMLSLGSIFKSLLSIWSIFESQLLSQGSILESYLLSLGSIFQTQLLSLGWIFESQLLFLKSTFESQMLTLWNIFEKSTGFRREHIWKHICSFTPLL